MAEISDELFHKNKEIVLGGEEVDDKIQI